MRRSAMIGALAVAMTGMMAGPGVAHDLTSSGPLDGLEPLYGGRQSFRRGKGKQARPRKRPNMRHVSRRVRRKHRRAA